MCPNIMIAMLLQAMHVHMCKSSHTCSSMRMRPIAPAQARPTGELVVGELDSTVPLAEEPQGQNEGPTIEEIADLCLAYAHVHPLRCDALRYVA